MTNYYINEQRTMNNEQFTNEPNLCETNTILSNEPNLRGKVTHLINEQRTVNNLQTNPISPQINVTSVMTNYYINEQRTMNHEQFTNEPSVYFC